MNRQTFFDGIRHTPLFPNGLSTSQVDGLNAKLDVWGQWYDDKYPIEFLAACLVQAWHETGGRMLPVRETNAATDDSAIRILQKAYDNKQLPWVKTPYWNRDQNGQSWIGRGDIQLTHKANYKKLEDQIGLIYGVTVPMSLDPTLAMDPVVSAVVMFEGMIKGLFRKGENVDKYFAGANMDYVGQRAVVNGDRADKKIQAHMKLGTIFEKALRDAGAQKGIDAMVQRLLPGMASTPAPLPAPSKGESRVRRVQERLSAHGFPCAADGVYGPKTQKAIDAFEAAFNIRLDHVDAATWDALQKPAAGETHEAAAA